MKMKPVIALVPEDVETLLIPIVDQIAASIRTSSENNLTAMLTMGLNGWTFEMLAYGRLLAALTECGVTVQGGS